MKKTLAVSKLKKVVNYPPTPEAMGWASWVKAPFYKMELHEAIAKGK